MGQRPRALHPELSGLHLLGARLRALRIDRGLSQSALGQLVFCSGHLIGKIEKGERRPQPDLVRRCDTVLHAQGTLLGLELSTDLQRPAKESSTTQAISACIPLLRATLDAHDVPDDGPIRPLQELRDEVQRVVDWRLNSRYADLALNLPALLPELHRAHQSSHDPGTAVLLTQTYRAADALADKFGYFDLSARIIELMRSTALRSADPLTIAATEYVRAEAFFATASWSAGRRMLDRAATAVDVDGSPAANATYGTLHMRAAVLAAREGDADTARDHIAEAADAARDIPEGIYRGTAFGPASVRIHQLSLCLDSDDIENALAVAAGWSPPTTVPAERRSHFYADLARAYVRVNRGDAAIDSLQIARQIAPQHIRYHAEVKTTLATLLAKAIRPSPALIEMSRWTGVSREIS